MRIPVNAPKAPKVSGPYSQGNVAGEFVFVSGQGSLDAETGEIIRTSIKRYFTGPMSACSCVQAGLDGIKVEIDAVAWISGDKQGGS